MINSLRPLLADCPAVLQQKWHWEHLSMLPDNAHKCEICQTQYVNNHNCTGWGHVQANPTEMLLDDCGVNRFQRCDSLQMLPWRKEQKLRRKQEASVLHAHKCRVSPISVPLIPSVSIFIIYILCIFDIYLEEVPLKSCGSCKGYGKEKAKIQSQIAASTLSYLHKLEGVGGTKAKKLKETDCREVCNSRNLEVGGGQEKKNPIKTSWGGDEEPR